MIDSYKIESSLVALPLNETNDDYLSENSDFDDKPEDSYLWARSKFKEFIMSTIYWYWAAAKGWS